MPHIHKKYDFVVNAFIVCDGQILLVNHPRYHQWLSVGGHVELDEDPEIALYREIAEETGLRAVEILGNKPTIRSPGTKFLLMPNYLDVHEANPPHKHICLNYFVRTKSKKIVLSHEHSEAKWFSLSELEEKQYNLSPVIVFYAQEALKAAAQ